MYASVHGHAPILRRKEPLTDEKSGPRKVGRGENFYDSTILGFYEFMTFACEGVILPTRKNIYVYIQVDPKCKESLRRVSRCCVLLRASVREHAPILRRKEPPTDERTRPQESWEDGTFTIL